MVSAPERAERTPHLSLGRDERRGRPLPRVAACLRRRGFPANEWRWGVLALVCLLAPGCRRAAEFATGPLPQRVYVWQREWTPAVAEALAEVDRRTEGAVVLGGEVGWRNGTPEVRLATLDWPALAEGGKPRALALRVAPFPGPFAAEDANADAIVAATRSLLAEAAAHGVALAEFQIDFDCAQRKLAGYRLWLRRLRAVVPRSTRFVMTALPAWLQEREFRSLGDEVDGYVLQVHSVPTQRESGRAELFDPVLARGWVREAAKLGRPFSVALPTYRCVAGYEATGKLLGVYMESVAPRWPAGTTTLELAAEAEPLAEMVREWQTQRPRELRELIWYRAPVASDARNWRWPTLAAVMAGRAPRHDLQIARAPGNPVDLTLVNAGEAEELLDSVVIARWEAGTLEAADALEGWNVVTAPGGARFIPTLPPRQRLLPGARRSIGWLRFAQPTTVEARVETE